ncbi:hypothetical protein [Azospirillum sp. SYSU D00513]|uniref:hypothetical protein n=1 Tax=Azospirillum sp. SYSU D00513 TaxID=2812561 RepID=UPI001A978ABB|nr:hypothetical protein [Azospirillum sp. SYSU D00513]
MDDSSNDPLLARIDRLTEQVSRRLDQLEERLRLLEQDNGEIINLLIAVKAGLEEATGEILVEVEEDGEGMAPDAVLH